MTRSILGLTKCNKSNTYLNQGTATLSCRDLQHYLAWKLQIMMFVNESITDNELGADLYLSSTWFEISYAINNFLL